MLRFISLYFRWVGLGVSNTIGLAIRLGFGSSVGIFVSSLYWKYITFKAIEIYFSLGKKSYAF